MTDREFAPGGETRDTPAQMTCLRCKIGTAHRSGIYAGAAIYYCVVCLGSFAVQGPEQATRRACGCCADPGVFGHQHGPG